MQKGFVEPGEKPRRFYRDVSVAAADSGFEVLLDGRSVKTPKGARLSAPSRAVAEQIAEEWAGQADHLELADMHATRLANTALEGVGPTREAVALQIAEYAGSDLLCYFAEAPEALVARQRAAWGPILAKAEAAEDLQFVRAVGVIHQEQPPATLTKMREIALAMDDFTLAGFAFASALFGSTLLGLALQRGWLSADEAFDLSRLDEAFQEEQWGVDEEAAERTARLREEARMVGRWFQGLRG
jgi:chaperone required for assembly of F1-ATPase